MGFSDWILNDLAYNAHEETNIQKFNNISESRFTINSVGNGAGKHPPFDVDENISIIQIFGKEVWQNESKDKICMV